MTTSLRPIDREHQYRRWRERCRLAFVDWWERAFKDAGVGLPMATTSDELWIDRASVEQEAGWKNHQGC
jgi:hypothetical protein